MICAVLSKARTQCPSDQKIFELRLPLQINMNWKVSCICIFLLCNIWMVGCYGILLGKSLKISHEG